MMRQILKEHGFLLPALCAAAFLLSACSLGGAPVQQLGTPPFPPPLQPPKPGSLAASGEVAASEEMQVSNVEETTTSSIEVSELSREQQDTAPSRQDHYRVQEGDTLFSISNDTQTRLTELVDLNNLKPPYRLEPGRQLQLPRRQEVASSTEKDVEATQQDSVEEATTSPSEPASEAGTDTTVGNDDPATVRDAPDMSEPDSGDIPVAAKTGPIGDPPALTGQGFAWPLEGEIISGYGAQGDGRHNDGINIAASEGSVVHASESGVVAYAGNELRGFGNLLLIRHQDGWVSAYGHNRRLLVGRGADVERGQPIAEVGASGSVSKPQLHFEIRKGTRAMDPLEILED